jgi:hypothetical protein
MVKLIEPGILTQAVDNEVTTVCEVGSIGKSSIEFRYQILFGDRFEHTHTHLLSMAAQITQECQSGNPPAAS